ncbi:anhydro-N-acetylmuramic acid kinase [Salinimonas lutimaris]|uniref:anhydro-N-acetylmuramic acid kinase n=1 Tax=Salinimonas lutimaris TaxID=914153 RepID=UPI0010C10706|nr:anhydro-N-acetylmuramic acid kinase [Salinimonas lutimaris]
MSYYIGLMSGTSMDGVDAVLCQTQETTFTTLDAISIDYPASLLGELNALCCTCENELNRTGQADVQVAVEFARAVNALLDKTGLRACDISAIGSHGQTIRHFPDAGPGFTLQIGDPATLAVLTGIPVVADFRRKDIALGGQGAPLAPGFHQAVFAADEARAIVNIGGIANISILSSAGATPQGYDTGPGNTLMDQWIAAHLQLPFDTNGQWAASAGISQPLLTRLLDDPYFSLPAPKSTGREYFHADWLQHCLTEFDSLCPAQVQATLCQFTATHIADAVKKAECDMREVYVCGGGAFNRHLIKQIQALLPACTVATTQALGVHPQQVEGAAFAWLAHAYFNKQPGNIPAVTGASRPAVLGGLYLPD